MAASLAASALPGGAASLEYVRGEAPWRLVTGQLVHWSWAMTATDLLVVAVAGAWIESRSRTLAALGIVAALAAVALAVGVASTELARYRGSSGVAVALVALAAMDLALTAPARGPRLLAAGALAVLGAKIAVEVATGASVVPWSLPAGVVVAGKAHVAGAVVGVLLALGYRSHRPR